MSPSLPELIGSGIDTVIGYPPYTAGRKESDRLFLTLVSMFSLHFLNKQKNVSFSFCSPLTCFISLTVTNNHTDSSNSNRHFSPHPLLFW